MRFVVDECTGPRVASWLRSQGNDVVSIYDEHRGAGDEFVLRLAADEDRVLITNDKDFGERIFRHGERHRGVILLRLADERAATKIARLAVILPMLPADLSVRFVVATDRGLRITGP